MFVIALINSPVRQRECISDEVGVHGGGGIEHNPRNENTTTHHTTPKHIIRQHVRPGMLIYGGNYDFSQHLLDCDPHFQVCYQTLSGSLCLCRPTTTSSSSSGRTYTQPRRQSTQFLALFTMCTACRRRRRGRRTAIVDPIL